MGLHICVMRPDQPGDHPQWDWTRYAGDREFADLAMTLPRTTKTSGDQCDDRSFFRPKNFAVWREAIGNVEWPCESRYSNLLDILERDSDYWIYFSW